MSSSQATSSQISRPGYVESEQPQSLTPTSTAPIVQRTADVFSNDANKTLAKVQALLKRQQRPKTSSEEALQAFHFGFEDPNTGLTSKADAARTYAPNSKTKFPDLKLLDINSSYSSTPDPIPQTPKMQRQNSSPAPQQVNGGGAGAGMAAMNVGMPMNTGQQMDLNHVWNLVEGLSAQLKENREKTNAIIRAAKDIAVSS